MSVNKTATEIQQSYRDLWAKELLNTYYNELKPWQHQYFKQLQDVVAAKARHSRLKVRRAHVLSVLTPERGLSALSRLSPLKRTLSEKPPSLRVDLTLTHRRGPGVQEHTAEIQQEWLNSPPITAASIAKAKALLNEKGVPPPHSYFPGPWEAYVDPKYRD